MVKRHFMKKVLSTAIALTIATVFSFGTTVMAAENTETQIKHQEPIQITESEPIDDNMPYKIREQIHFDSRKALSLTSRMEKLDIESANLNSVASTTSVDDTAESTIIAGTVSGYLKETEDAAIYNISLPANLYLQAQLTTPANADLDYDLYLLDSEGTILVASEYYTYVNGTTGTLPEALGYITSGDEATYYLYVLSSSGGSVTESFTLDYSISINADSHEVDDFAREALPFTFGTDGNFISSRSLGSPVDNDWYVFSIPENRIYSKLNLSAITQSSNTCSVEVYQNISSNGYQMKRIGNGNVVSISTGTYYVRVSNAKTMEQFDDLDVQTYTLTITPVLTADKIEITGLRGSEGLNKYVTYPGYGNYFRTQGSGTLTIYGKATATDPVTNVTYEVANTQINGIYYSPAWENNNTSANAIRTGIGYTDSQGLFEIEISLPSAIGTNMYDVGTSYHYFDVCAVSASLNDNSNVIASKAIFHLAYTMYHPF